MYLCQYQSNNNVPKQHHTSTSVHILLTIQFLFITLSLSRKELSYFHKILDEDPSEDG